MHDPLTEQVRAYAPREASVHYLMGKVRTRVFPLSNACIGPLPFPPTGLNPHHHPTTRSASGWGGRSARCDTW